MFFYIILKSFLIFLVGTIILHIGGRKSISQMTIPQVVLMIGLGSLLIQPVAGYGLGYTFLAAAVLVLIMLLFEYIYLKFDSFETISTGKAQIVIENGQIQQETLKKLRLTVDKLEARLRQKGISSIDDVELATLEVSGQLGYMLKYEKQPATKGDIQMILERLNQIQHTNTSHIDHHAVSNTNIFTEIKHKQYEGNSKEPN